MRSQILFQMDHCPAMFDNCHRYQGMTGPLKMAKQNSTKYRAVVEFKAASHPMSSHCPVQTEHLKKSNPFHDSWWWIYAAFFASACHQTRCIYANCELSVREMYRWRLAANESLAQSTPWHRVLQTCNEPKSIGCFAKRVEKYCLQNEDTLIGSADSFYCWILFVYVSLASSSKIAMSSISWRGGLSIVEWLANIPVFYRLACK